jgi:hypothetical protein
VESWQSATLATIINITNPDPNLYFGMWWLLW